MEVLEPLGPALGGTLLPQQENPALAQGQAPAVAGELLLQLWEKLQGPPSDLEQQLRKYHQRLEEHEQEVAGPEPDPLPEFLQVRNSLQKVKLAEAGAWQT
ncbi:hypothetical protein Nmel_017979 [Mimus melanotis]